jgi:replicative DNA helicase
MKMTTGLDIIYVDYLQIVSVPNKEKGNREQEISQISRTFKMLSKELNVPLISLSQLSRAVETRGGAKKPVLSDLRESGAIEQDADVVEFIYRPEYYGILKDDQGNDLQGLAYVLISKNRHGELADVPLKFINHLTKFENIIEVYDNEEDHNFEPNNDFNNETPF